MGTCISILGGVKCSMGLGVVSGPVRGRRCVCVCSHLFGHSFGGGGVGGCVSAGRFISTVSKMSLYVASFLGGPVFGDLG